MFVTVRKCTLHNTCQFFGDYINQLYIIQKNQYPVQKTLNSRHVKNQKRFIQITVPTKFTKYADKKYLLTEKGGRNH